MNGDERQRTELLIFALGYSIGALMRAQAVMARTLSVPADEDEAATRAIRFLETIRERILPDTVRAEVERLKASETLRHTPERKVDSK